MMHNFLRYHWPLLFFLAAALLATAFSVDRPQSIRVQLPLWFSLVCYIVIVGLVDTQRYLRILSILLPISVFFVLAFILPEAIEVQTDNPLAQVKMLNSIFLVVPNDVLVLSVMAPLVLGVAWSSGWWLRGFAVCYLLLALIVGVNMQSRQTVFLLLLGSVAVVTLIRPRWAVPAVLISVAVGVLIDGLSGWILSQKIFMFPRTYVWHAAWEMFLDRPWAGQGPGLFKDNYFAFLGKAGYLIPELPDRRPMYWAHNLYLEQLAERGIFGLLALLSLLVVAMRNAGTVLRQAADNSVRSIAAGALVAVTVLAIAGIAEATLSRLWVMFSLLVLSALCGAIFRTNHN